MQCSVGVVLRHRPVSQGQRTPSVDEKQLLLEGLFSLQAEKLRSVADWQCEFGDSIGHFKPLFKNFSAKIESLFP